MPTLLSQIKMPSGTVYDIKDAWARTQIEAITGGSAVVFIGVSTTAITDGGTEVPTIPGWSDTVSTGNIVFYGKKEFIWGNDSKWHELGDTTAVAVSITVEADPNGNYTPSGNVTQPTFSGNSMTSTGTFTPSGNVSVSFSGTTNKTATVTNTTGTATYTPAGNVSQPTFSGNSLTSTGSYTPTGNVTLTKSNKTAAVSPASSGTNTYTPAGNVSTPTITVTPSTTNINNPTSKTVTNALATAAPEATAPSNAVTYCSVTNEILSLYQLGYTTTDSITTTETTVATGIQSATSSTPTFTGDGVRLVTDNISTADSASFTGDSGSVSVSGTPEGTVSQPTFTGDGVRLVTGNIEVPSGVTGSFEGTQGSVSVSGTPEGTVSKPTFTGDTVKISGETTSA